MDRDLRYLLLVICGLGEVFFAVWNPPTPFGVGGLNIGCGGADGLRAPPTGGGANRGGGVVGDF